MWQQWKKTAPLMQVFIIGLCALAAYQGKSAGFVAMTFVLMQIGSLLGAWWGAKIKRKIEDRESRLPLQDRL